MTTTTITPKVVDVLNALTELDEYPATTTNLWHGVDLNAGQYKVRLVEDDTDILVTVLTHNDVALTKASFTWTASDAIAAFVAYYLN